VYMYAVCSPLFKCDNVVIGRGLLAYPVWCPAKIKTALKEAVVDVCIL
jgi:hypothetical protein